MHGRKILPNGCLLKNSNYSHSAHKEAIANAKTEKKKNTSINSASPTTPSGSTMASDNTTSSQGEVDVPSELEPTFPEIMVAKRQPMVTHGFVLLNHVG